MRLAGCKSALNPPPPTPPVVYSADRSGAVVPVLVLLFGALCFFFCEAICCMSSFCHFVLVFFGPFGVAIASLGEESAGLGVFRMFG